MKNQFENISLKKSDAKNTSLEKKWIIWREITFAFLKIWITARNSKDGECHQLRGFIL